MDNVSLEKNPGRSLPEVVERILDKGIVINADIAVNVGDVELLDIKIRAAVASFETAARYGLAFPSGTDLSSPAWEEASKKMARCPECGNRREEESLVREGCRVCGWTSPLRLRDNVDR